MFSVSAGGRDIAKNRLAPHTKMNIVMKSGMIDQVSSSTRPPEMRAPTPCGDRRRNLIA